MQIIQGIRDKGAAIVIVVIALSLIGFILMDAKQGSNRMFSSASANIGKVNGSAIEQDEFNKRVNILEVQEEQQSRAKPTTARIAQIREQVWNQIVAEKVFYAEAAKLGIDFTPQELNTILYSNDQSNPFLQDKEMVNPVTGKIDSLKVQQTIKNIQKLTGEKAEMMNAQINDPQKLTSISTKYYALLNASVYYPAWMEEKDIAENKSFANIAYVAIPYTTIADSTIKVTDEEIENYVQKHKDLFKQEEGRMISYVSFSQLPSADDSAATKDAVEKLRNEFATETNIKTFLARNTSAIEFDTNYLPKSKIISSAKDTLIKQPVGGLFGPYVDRGDYVLAKIIGIKTLPDSVRARHILIGTVNPQTGEPILEDSIAKKMADSIFIAIKGGADFVALAKKYSTDGSKDQGGDLGTFEYGKMVPEFNKFSFENPVGSRDVVRTQFGYHVIEIMNQKGQSLAYKIAYMAKEILASEETINKASNEAIKLSAQKDSKSVDAYLKKINMVKVPNLTLIKENDAQIGPMQDARQLVRWVFGAKQGEVSDPYSIGDQFVVAIVDKVQKEGTQDIQTVKLNAQTERNPAKNPEKMIRDEKKAADIIKKLGSTPTLEGAAAAYNKQVATAGLDSSLTFTSQIINGIGMEPKLIGACFNKANLNKVSGPIAGKTGVYVFKVNGIANKAPDTAEQATQLRTQQIANLRNQATGNWFEALRKKATIKDNRSSFY